jgi:WD40 repeat protein
MKAALTSTFAIWLLACPAHGQKAELVVETGHTEMVFSVAFSPDGRTLASGSADNTIKLWDVASGRELRTLAGHTDGVISIAFASTAAPFCQGARMVQSAFGMRRQAISSLRCMLSIRTIGPSSIPLADSIRRIPQQTP